MSLPYFQEQGWEAEVLTVDPTHSDFPLDPLLVETVPEYLRVHKVSALAKQYTRKLGLGAIALRALPYLCMAGDQLLKSGRFDLVYFSTTQFPVCVLGARWKRKYGIPFVIDMQDPWHSEYYKNKPKSERPAKYWFSYRLNKWLEPVAMRSVGGLISVSQPYIDTLRQRYPELRSVPADTITFGAFAPDMTIARKAASHFPDLLAATSGKVNVVYAGRGGKDMQDAVHILFSALRKGLDNGFAELERLHFYFIGTSYAPAGTGKLTISPVAATMEVSNFVTEITDRIPFFHTLATLGSADALFVPGSNDAQYTASKIYPYVLAEKPLLAIFHPASSVVSFLKQCGVGTIITFEEPEDQSISRILNFLCQLVSGKVIPTTPASETLASFSANTMTIRQCAVFNAVIGNTQTAFVQ